MKRIIWLVVVFIILLGIAYWIYTLYHSPKMNSVGYTSTSTNTSQNYSTSTGTNTNNMNDNQTNNNTTKVVASSTTADGLVIEDTKIGSGAEAKQGDTVSVKYTGKLADGTVFDATSKHDGQPIQFTLGSGMVIAGWEEGIVGMKVGGQRTLIIPPALAYGANGRPGAIPPNATLTFDVTLENVQ
jgi:FKBP-type peptidyl-prolyl cis-trans isomerase FkpA